MPYGIRKVGKFWKVINKITGHVFGTHPSREHAERQIAALHANVVEKSSLLDFSSIGIVYGGEEMALRKTQLAMQFEKEKHVGETKTENGKEYVLKAEKRQDAPRWHRIEAKHVSGGDIFHAKAEDREGRATHFIAQRQSENVWHHQPDKSLPAKKIEDAEIIKELEAQHKQHHAEKDSKKMIMPVQMGTPIGTIDMDEEDDIPITPDLNFGGEEDEHVEPDLTDEEEEEVAKETKGKSKEEKAEARREFHRNKLEKKRAQQKREQEEIKRQMNDPEYAPQYVNGKFIKPKDEPLMSKEDLEKQKEKQGALFDEKKDIQETPIEVKRDEAFDAMKIKLMQDILTTTPKSFTDIVKLVQPEKKGEKKKYEDISDNKKALIAEVLQDLHQEGVLWDGYEEPYKEHVDFKKLHSKNQRYAISPEGAKALTGQKELMKSLSWTLWRIFNKSKISQLMEFIDYHENNILAKAKRAGRDISMIPEKIKWEENKVEEEKVMEGINQAVSKKLSEEQTTDKGNNAAI